ncbi:hypothetical protein FB451DRAFT_1182423 [Mycena latifolia]|nr:hypothetical protein FB451DRAFT_1182423 [Mycena latifolia]
MKFMSFPHFYWFLVPQNKCERKEIKHRGAVSGSTSINRSVADWTSLGSNPAVYDAVSRPLELDYPPNNARSPACCWQNPAILPFDPAEWQAKWLNWIWLGRIWQNTLGSGI